MSYLYSALILYTTTAGRFANLTGTPTVTAFDFAGNAISSPTITNIATGVYKVEVTQNDLEDVLFRVVPHADDLAAFPDVAVMQDKVVHSLTSYAAQLAAIKNKTDQLAFTVPNKVDASATVDTSGIAGNVWAYPIRALTVSSVKPRTLVEGDQFSIYKDTSITIPITGLGDISGYSNLWFTIKREQDLELADAQSIVHMDYLTGLLYINKAVATAGHGAVMLDDLTLGNLRATITKDGAALLPVYAKEALRWEVKGVAGAVVDILLQGTCYIQPAVTRKIT